MKKLNYFFFQLLNDKNYLKKVKKFKKMYLKFGPITQLEVAEFQTNRIIKNNEKKLFHKFNGTKLPFYYYSNFDTLFYLFALIFIIFY